MNRRTLLGVVAALLLGLLTLGTTGIPAGAEDETVGQTTAETFVMYGGERHFRSLDLARRGPSRFDRLYVWGKMYSDEERQTQVGRVRAICEWFTTRRPYCTNEAEIDGRGKILSASFQDIRQPGFTDAILGGTGDFRAARGQVIVDFTTGTITVELE
ncbi:MAG: hypothetical protein ACRDIX_06650 [Actinomycetota bacterium]